LLTILFSDKNVEVRDDVDIKGTWIPNITTLIDFMGIKAEGCLKVNRETGLMRILI
jgi:hypothetical protein